ncbi:C-GCAxxG-C-C family protein [Ruminococcaceae bacterium OttesenSCG-928-D13]|nr:C-GCAxxG-C-C family protein [Ruminococcaceae bacterium OttesenSCG-928-D13]
MGKYDIDEMVARYRAQGYHCSQTMMLVSMELRGIEDDFTIRALGALGGGMSDQRTCGALVGAVCALSSHYPRPEGEPEPAGYKPPAKELVQWFQQEFGSIECRDLVEYDKAIIAQVCPGIMAKTFEKMQEILKKHEAPGA